MKGYEVEKSCMLQVFADLATLVYHEGRNVRHLIRAGLIGDPQRYVHLTDLPAKREEAWKVLQKLRNAAKMKKDVKKIVDMYSGHFELTLEEMSQLFRHDAWRDSKVGGNKWGAITDSVILLRDTLIEAERLTDCTLSMNHNTGVVVDKLEKLDHALIQEGFSSSRKA